MIDVLGFVRETDGDKIDGPTYYRSYLPLREVNRSEHITARLIDGKSLEGSADADLPPFDIVTMARMYLGDCEAFIGEIHRRGGVLVLDSDDDLTETHKLVSGRGQEFCEVLGMVDYVTASTQPLVDLFAQHTKRPPVLLQNYVDSEWMQTVAVTANRLDALEGKLTIGFTGSPTHWGDWRMPAVPFARILREHDVRGILHGEVPRYLGFAADNLVKIAGVPMVIYPIVLSQFDIVLCAVDSQDPFNVGKSAVKALECMALGIVPICSQFEPYMDLKEAGAPIVVIPDESPDGWYRAMSGLINEPDWRMELSEAGPGWIRENRDMVKTGWQHWASFYEGVV